MLRETANYINIKYALYFVYRCRSIRQRIDCRPDAGYVNMPLLCVSVTLKW